MANDLLDIVDGKVSLHLHPGQEKAWDSDARFIFVIAGTQSGKTTFGPWWLWREIGLCGEGDYLAVTATYDLFKLKMLPEMRRVFCELLSNEGWEWRAGDRVIQSAKRKARIVLRSANTPEGLESATAKAAWLDECGQDNFKLSSWEAVQRRLSLHQGRALGTTTPYNMGWLKTQVFDRWRDDDHDYQVISFKSTENPSFPPEEYERARNTLSTWKFNMFYNGEFTRPAGMIYEDFDEANLVDPFIIPKGWPIYIGVDFGGVNTGIVWVAHDTESDVYYLYREYLRGDQTTQEHVDNMYALSGKHKENGTWLGGENIVRMAGGSKSEGQFRMDWDAAGAFLDEPEIAEVEPGIDRVTALIKTKRLKVFNNLSGIKDEFYGYARVLGQDGQPTEKIQEKEKYHMMDCTRYVSQLLVSGRWLIY